MVASSTAAKAAQTDNQKQMGHLEKTTSFKKVAKEPPTPAPRRAKQVVDRRSRPKKKAEHNETAPMFSWMRAEFQVMKADIQMVKDKIIRIENERQERREDLQRRVAIEELMQRIPCAWQVNGKNFTSFNEAETWFASQTYGQGSGMDDTNMTAFAAGDFMDIDTECPRFDIQSFDKHVQDFIKKLDDKEKSSVDFQDFKGLPEELQKCERSSLPPSLVPIRDILLNTYGDITAGSNQSKPLIRESYILLCSVIKEMNEVQLEQVDLRKMILWRDAINSGLSIGLKGFFAIEHLKKIARAYFGSKARNDQELKSLAERMSELKVELYALEKKHNSIIERQSSEMRRECLRDQEYFQGKPLSAGLFLL